MEVVIVRHAEPAWGRGTLLADPGLSDRGARQAELLAERLAGERFDRVVVSTVRRAVDTARVLGRTLDTPWVSEEWLDDVRHPDWSGYPNDEVRALLDSTRRMTPNERWAGFPGGEPVMAFDRRVRSGMRRLLGELGVHRVEHELPLWQVAQPGTRVLLVGHKGSNAVVIADLIGATPTPWEWDRFVLGHASLTRLSAVRAGDHWAFSLERLNDIEHLPAAMRTR